MSPILISGDVTGSGAVDALDVMTTISHILGQKPVQFFEEAADMNADGKVDITDVTELIEKLKSRKRLCVHKKVHKKSLFVLRAGLVELTCEVEYRGSGAGEK